MSCDTAQPINCQVPRDTLLYCNVITWDSAVSNHIKGGLSNKRSVEVRCQFQHRITKQRYQIALVTAVNGIVLSGIVLSAALCYQCSAIIAIVAYVTLVVVIPLSDLSEIVSLYLQPQGKERFYFIYFLSSFWTTRVPRSSCLSRRTISGLQILSGLTTHELTISDRDRGYSLT